jgi:hypothetical protein
MGNLSYVTSKSANLHTNYKLAQFFQWCKIAAEDSYVGSAPCSH